MNNFNKPVFIDLKSIFNTLYTILGILAIYSFAVSYIDVSSKVIFEYAVDYTMYAVLIIGLFTASAWFCRNVLATKLEGFLVNIPKFKYASVVAVWDLYFLAWRKYLCFSGFILALLLFIEKVIIG